ncbi:unnamed protein product [Effrenium voratum]|uniref:Glycosyl transferase 48 domain-containing protein n=1 Tax=Effrenium voratum TaxID=2562239 RepID=A0AA36J579_9DINO|nr:unnamed protein product [Effrenium voratum]
MALAFEAETHRPASGPGRRCPFGVASGVKTSFTVTLEKNETLLGSMQDELQEGVDLKEDAQVAEKEAELKELKEEPQHPDRHEFVVPMPKAKEDAGEEDRAEEPDEAAAGGAPAGEPGAPPGDDFEAGYEEGYDEGYDEGYSEEGVPLMDKDLKLADIRFDSKVDPQLNRIADQVNSKIDMVEDRLLGNRLQNVVVPLPATEASRDASSVHVFLGNQSATNPDVGTPLDEVNQLLQKANTVEKSLVTSNLQLKLSAAPLLLPRWSVKAKVLALKFLVSFAIFNSVYHLMHEDLQIIMLGQQSVTEMQYSWASTDWGQDVLEWALLWFTTFFLFCADTGMWFTVGCTFLGVGTAFVQRSCEVFTFCFEDAVAKIPERMSEKVFSFVKSAVEGREMAREFPMIWDRVLEYMRYEDKVGFQFMSDQSFQTSHGHVGVDWQSLTRPIRAPLRSDGAEGSQRRIAVPNMFQEHGVVQRAFLHYGCCIRDPNWPENPEVQWRLLALSRGLGLPIPKPFRAPFMPGITVLIPHYGETIIEKKESLYGGRDDDIVPLMDWLKARYEDEWHHFDARMQAKNLGGLRAGTNWDEYTDEQWAKICGWSSMRLQTLFRTVAGMMLYHPALMCHNEVQGVGRIRGERKPALAEVWTPNDCFNCIISMQQYGIPGAISYSDTNKMFAKFPSSLKVAFIDFKEKNVHAEVDGVHARQKRRYFSCLVDASSPEQSPGSGSGGRREARFSVELPGYPILGDGKSDNQNHAIIFLRGIFSQCIDANQGGYFEQMLLLPCVLGEFRTLERGDREAKQIIGLPEHITSDIGSIGDFAAGSEVAFGTLLQRTYSVLGARMHYGHPDIMNKQYMMQQGGVSKATKTINLSEDIFAGMDFTLRGQGRSIKHCEYFHVAKGRDLGFNTVLGFFSKLSSGAGEQILTRPLGREGHVGRQMFRLHQLLHLPEAFTFYYAHALSSVRRTNPRQQQNTGQLNL